MACAVQGCTAYAPFGSPEKSAKKRFCRVHAEPGAMNLMRGRLCVCGKVASFATSWDERPVCCKQCKPKTGMICVTGYRCLKCDRSAVYNLPGSHKPDYCSDHKTNGMLNVKTRRCEVEGCTSQPKLRVSGATGPPTRCVKHRTPLTENISRMSCGIEGCAKRRFYGVPGERPLTCARHGKPLGYVNLETLARRAKRKFAMFAEDSDPSESFESLNSLE